MKKRLVVSFSGGRTSAFMLWWIFNVWEDRHSWEILVIFANTGKEVEGTLFFVDECAQEWNIPIVWVEAVPSDKGKGWAVNHKIVTYETASRNGEPFEAMIAKLGIPCSEAPFCSDQLKRKSIESFLKSVGWDDYTIALGIRHDEPKRLKKYKKSKRKVFLPLAKEFPVNKAWVINWWNNNSFNLYIHTDDGNCDNCWKKGLNVLCRNAQRNPKSFEWWQRITDKFGTYNPRNNEIKNGESFNFYRGGISPHKIIELSNKLSQEDIKQLTMFDEVNECGESCEVF